MSENEKFDLIIEKLGSIDSRLDGIDNRLDGMDNRLDNMDNRLDNMDNRLEVVETDLRSVKLQLENEISRNIKIVAEGHLDLSRNLYEAMKPSNTMEMLQVQVNMLESKVRDLERKISA